MNLERIKLPETVEKRAKLVFDNVSENIKKIEERTQPRLDDLQKRFQNMTNVDALREKIRINEYKERLSAETNNVREKASNWFEEGYVNVLDLLGLATKDEVETLRKKLTTLQRKVQKLNKSMEN